MPTFTAISLDSLLDRPSPKSSGKVKPPIAPKLEKKNPNIDKENQNYRQKLVSPLLYTTPASTPLPDSSSSASSYPPSPYVVNHKRRGPRLLKSISHDEISLQQSSKNDEGKIDNNGETLNSSIKDEFLNSGPVSIPISEVGSTKNGFCDDNKLGKSFNLDDDHEIGKIDDIFNPVPRESEREFEFDDLFDPQETKNLASNTEVEDSGAESSLKMGTPNGEFYDAYEELSCDGGTPSAIQDVETEQRQIRLNLLAEIEKRKQAEESLNKIQKHWQNLHQHLSVIGLKLPEFTSVVAEDGDLSCDPAEDLCQQIHISQIVSNIVATEFTKSEAKMEMESQIESKNFEISRLLDRIHYYEIVNQEMFQRNQETIEMERRLRQRRKQKQKWIWSSIGVAISLGTAALVWSYNSTSNESSSTIVSDAPESSSDGRTEP